MTGSLWLDYGKEIVTLIGIVSVVVTTTWRLRRFIDDSLRSTRHDLREQMTGINREVYLVREQVIALDGKMATQHASLTGDVRVLSVKVEATNGRVAGSEEDIVEIRNAMLNAMQVHSRVMEGVVSELAIRRATGRGGAE